VSQGSGLLDGVADSPAPKPRVGPSKLHHHSFFRVLSVFEAVVLGMIRFLTRTDYERFRTSCAARRGVVKYRLGIKSTNGRYISG
jgi:hypothetical protein